MARVFIGIGSNVGDRRKHLALARTALDALPRTRLVAFSKVIETDPVGPVPQDRFLNAVAELETGLSPDRLLWNLQLIETRLGRPRRARQA